ncbi:MAG: twin-arginine translocation signal domain-containing protein, partial [Planctomycetota bacterium]
MATTYTRRDFVKTAGIGIAALTLSRV